jgi:hypothetical protein
MAIWSIVIGGVVKLIAGFFGGFWIKHAAKQQGKTEEKLATVEKTRTAEQAVAREVATERTDAEVINDLENRRF